MAVDLRGTIIDDYRFIYRNGSDKQHNAVWRAECIYCHKQRDYSTKRIRDNKHLTCTDCNDTRGRFMPHEEKEIVDAYLTGEPVKAISYRLSVSIRSLYNMLHRNGVELRRRSHD